MLVYRAIQNALNARFTFRRMYRNARANSASLKLSTKHAADCEYFDVYIEYNSKTARIVQESRENDILEYAKMILANRLAEFVRESSIYRFEKKCAHYTISDAYYAARNYYRDTHEEHEKFEFQSAKRDALYLIEKLAQ